MTVTQKKVEKKKNKDLIQIHLLYLLHLFILFFFLITRTAFDL